MTTLVNWCLALVLSVVVLGCGGGGKSGGGGGGPQGPKTPEEALAKLTPEDRQTFENWKLQVLKSCDATQAFNGRSGSDIHDMGIDPAALLHKNSLSMVVKGPQGEMAFLGRTTGYSGESQSKFEYTVTVNGDSYTVQAEAKRNGSNCQVFLFGQKVYESVIARTMNVDSYWQPGTQAKSSIGRVSLKEYRGSEFAELKGHRFFEPLHDLQMALQESLPMIAGQLGLSREEAEKYFRLATEPGIESVRMIGWHNSLWMNSEYPQLVAPTEMLVELVRGASGNFALEWHRRAPRVQYGSVVNTSDSGSYKWVAKFRISSLENQPEQMNFALESVAYQGLVAFENSSASHCFQERVETLSRLDDSTARRDRVVPSVDEALTPCRALAQDLDQVVRENGRLKEVLATALAFVVPSRYADYAGWNEVLTEYALKVMRSGLHIQGELDPSGRVPVIQDVALNLEYLRAELTKVSGLQSALSETVYHMGLSWAYTGENVSPVHITRILMALERVVDVFPQSVESALWALAREPRSHEEELVFAEQMSVEYKAEALNTLNVARALDYPEWERETHNQILQKRPSLSELRQWGDRFRNLQHQFQAYPLLVSQRGALVGMVLQWLKTGEADEQQINWVLAGLNNSVDPFQKSTERLIQDLKRSFVQNRDAVAFAHSLTAEYKDLARAILAHSQAIGMERVGTELFESVLQDRLPIERLREMADTMAGASEFSTREKNRTGGDKDFYNDRYLKDLVKRAVKEGWSRQDFVTLEQITELGRLQSSCDSDTFYKGASSVAFCIGGDRFSRREGRYLDPRYGHVYGALALDFLTYMHRLKPEFDYSSVRGDLMSAFFSSFDMLWGKCELSVIQSRRAHLAQQMGQYLRETDTFKKWEWEKAIRETLDNCR
ncbi:MAG: hypothetical protein H6624_06570 [Bdellovibrionaceae bacterium]|nr:hypothetical protein [Bdellovibrionales bacterium]MCB9083988.1 hypothetical protein [Pseudobdellovibrionaceae bacterium]